MKALYYKRKCKAAEGSTQKLVADKIGVCSSRIDELKAIQNIMPESLPDKEMKLAVINLDDDEIVALRNSLVEPANCENVGETSWKEALALFDPKRQVDAILLKLQGEELQDVEKAIVSLCYMNSIPAVMLAQAGTKAETACRDFTAGTWPVCNKLEDVVKSLKMEIPRTLQLRELVQADIATRVEKYKKVKVVRHFGKRAAVALVPFAVAAVNLAGLLRLVKKIMKATGMSLSKQVSKSVAKVSVAEMARTAAIDQLGDVYSFAVATSILADLGSAFAAGGMSAAAATLDVVDVALLGSVSFVTGTLSAINAYLTRPRLVDTISRFVASLQVIYLLNPEMRRPQDESAEGEQEDEEEEDEEEEEEAQLAVDPGADDSQSGVPLLRSKQIKDQSMDAEVIEAEASKQGETVTAAQDISRLSLQNK